MFFISILIVSLVRDCQLIKNKTTKSYKRINYYYYKNISLKIKNPYKLFGSTSVISALNIQVKAKFKKTDIKSFLKIGYYKIISTQ